MVQKQLPRVEGQAWTASTSCEQRSRFEASRKKSMLIWGNISPLANTSSHRLSQGGVKISRVNANDFGNDWRMLDEVTEKAC